ncbi:O-antigen ligase family protein [Hymenobacter persicinus]|uniref:O-antigen ligase domain-containing protein n=1 Tax=Hymenobacter persicinus TaxID=2025506 RepID=A0A4Q5LG11_9BACT|nr:O-antigen ligase family protein [Hymenobacter persicinus]RYU84407.1 O-antigen ligase domain-containing protein [Hymenobacter persicinus]
MSASSLSHPPVRSFRQAYRSGHLSQYLLLLACVAGVVGLLASRALVALSPLVGVAAVLANPRLRAALPYWGRNTSTIVLTLLYALLLLGGFYTTATAIWKHEIFRQLPLLGVPLAFTLAVPLSGRQRFGVGALFVGGVALIGAATLGKYLLNPAAANELIGVGQNVASVTRIFHIHFSIMLALAFYFGLLLSRSPYARPVLRGLLRAAAVTAVLVLHVLAYRTGLLVFYVMLLADVVYLVVAKRQFLLGLALLLALVAAPVLAYKSLESVRQRYKATRYDIEQFYYGHDINDYSLAKRLAAWETARTIAANHPWLGVGAADAYAAMMEQYAYRDFGVLPKNRVMIHNQYLHYLVSSGITGLFLWLLVLLGPLAQPRQRRNPYVWHFLLILGTAMLVDSLLEIQIGFNLFVFLYGFLVVATERGPAGAPQNPA